MSDKVEYCYCGNILYKTIDGNGDYYVCPSFNKKWNPVDEFAYEYGIHPSSEFEQLNEQEALEFALRVGMTKEAFYKYIL